LQARLATHFGGAIAAASNEGFSAYTTQEERKIAGMDGTESAGGDVELF